jgi:hypothetical protein
VKKLDFHCDVCRELLRTGSEPDIRPFVSFEFGRSTYAPPVSDLFVVRPASDCERHVCSICLAGLAALASECLPAELMAMTVTERSAPAGMFCCLCGGSFAGLAAPIVPVGGVGDAHANCVETARAAAAGANEARAYAARLAEARVHAVRETTL